jgi:hypothetical protein
LTILELINSHFNSRTTFDHIGTKSVPLSDMNFPKIS